MDSGCLIDMTSKNYKEKAKELVLQMGYDAAFRFAMEKAEADTDWLFVLHCLSKMSIADEWIDISNNQWYIPRFSVINTHKLKYKRLYSKWKRIYGIGKSAVGRKDNLICNQISIGKTNTIGTSIFNPALAEIVYTWFLDKPSVIFDPFCGGPERGVVAYVLGHRYIGIDIREEQILANKEFNFDCNWIVSDANYYEFPQSDMIFTCPPYWNLEKYSDMEGDLSNQKTYTDFLRMYENIIKKCCSACNGYIVFMVGNIRDSGGFVLDIPGDTVRMFDNFGYGLYNEIVVYAVGSASVRTNFVNKKVTNVHQKILVFKRRY